MVRGVKDDKVALTPSAGIGIAPHQLGWTDQILTSNCPTQTFQNPLKQGWDSVRTKLHVLCGHVLSRHDGEGSREKTFGTFCLRGLYLGLWHPAARV